MSDYIGVITFDHSVYCRKEISGKSFKTKISDREVLIVFPSIPDDYNPDQPNLENGDLIVPNNLFKGKINWGFINTWPTGLFSVDSVLCYFSGNESDISEIYQDFPRWKEKLYKLNLIDIGEYLYPEQKLPALVRGGGFNDGLQIFEKRDKCLAYINNSRQTDPIQLHFVETKEAYTFSALKNLFEQAGSFQGIALSYELLITAYRSLERHDFRSAVILAGSALEQAIVKRMRSEYPSNTKFKKAKGNKNHLMLNGRFNWLKEKNIPISVSDYDKTIIKVRNDAAHDGICPSYGQTKLCLENCKKLIESYNSCKLERN